MVEVTYCGVCLLPCEYCRYTTTYVPKCQAWMKKNAAAEFERLIGALDSVSLVEGSAEDDSTKNQKKAFKTPADKKKAKGQIMVTFEVKKNRKMTTVFNLKDHGVDLKKAAKKFKVKFACSASVTDDVSGRGQVVAVQGDVLHSIVPLILELVPDVTEADIKLVEGKRK